MLKLTKITCYTVNHFIIWRSRIKAFLFWFRINDDFQCLLASFSVNKCVVSVFLPALEQVSKTEAILESRLLTVEMREAEDVDLMDSRIEGIEETLQEMARLVSGLKKKVQKKPSH